VTEDRVPADAPNAERLEHYLLGLLDEDSLDEVEARAFGDPAVAAALDEVETDLVDAYVGGTLDGSRRTAFERALPERPRLRARVAAARALAARPPRQATHTRWWLPLLAAAAVVVVAGVWLSRQTTTPVREEPPPTAMGESIDAAPPPLAGIPEEDSEPDAPALAPSAPEPPAPAQPARLTFALRLPAGTSRAAGATPVTVPASATHMLLRVPVEPGDDFPSYRLRVVSGAGTTIREETTSTLSPDRTLPLVIERRALPDGLYEVALDGLDARGVAEPLAFLQVRVATAGSP
jgi:hypothetical protein